MDVLSSTDTNTPLTGTVPTRIGLPVGVIKDAHGCDIHFQSKVSFVLGGWHGTGCGLCINVVWSV